MSAQDELIEYLKQIVPNAQVECAGCGGKTEAARAVEHGDKWYCDQECADKDNAILIRPEPKDVRVDGWSI
jgi:hypothetical protein